MDVGGSSASTTATPRTPHSPGASAIGSSGMAAPPRSAGGNDAGSIRPVTARTWQAMGAAPHAEEPRRLNVYTNDLYNNSGSGASSGDARPASPHYQPTSARPSTPGATPTPRSAERLQQQRISTPSRLQGDGVSSPRQRVQQLPGLSTANVPTSPQQEQDSIDAISPRPHQQQQQQQQHTEDSQPTSTSPSKAPALRTSTISLTALKLPAAAAPTALDRAAMAPRPNTASGISISSSIAMDSPRVRQQVMRNFAGAMPTGNGSGGATSPVGTTPRPMLHGERSPGGAGSGPANGRPSTPSFQPVVLATRPATAMGGPMAGNSPSADAQFTIKAAHGTGAQGMPLRPQGAYPQPPSTAPSKAAGAPLQAAPAQAHQPGSLASFGISSAAFVSAAAKQAGARGIDEAEGGGKAALVALTQAAMQASTTFTTKAELRRFLLTPGPADKPLCCKILRSGGGLLKGGPQYTLLVEQEGGKGGAFLLAARKRKGGPGGGTYLLSVDQHDVSRHSASYVGKLRSNFIGTEFVFYDGSAGKGENGARSELGAVLYQTNVLGTKGPRKMTVLIPKLEASGTKPQGVAAQSEADTLLGQYKSYSLSGCVVLRNKPPRWNQGMSAYCLNFGGRVTQASVKNFQLVSVDNMERTILQFGKVAHDAFTMDYSYPMTALQAFAICLSSFDSKLACE